MSRTAVEVLNKRKALVLQLIYERSNCGARPVRLSYREIAEHADCSQSSAIYCIKSLISEGLVAKRFCFSSDGGQRSNAYVLVLPASKTEQGRFSRSESDTRKTVKR